VYSVDTHIDVSRSELDVRGDIGIILSLVQVLNDLRL